ncbi:putative versatile peroxidase [Mycena alexandri]|uniref:Peroxidase n=1 Tax=Mycena alexandri TaxID=1745969 RepID=A0AAD6WXI8_9AGAR|nr:putative versatile peroxidase [Mycena alexandri]
MKLFTLSTLSLVYITTISATPSPRATCSKGRTATSGSCCVWYNVLDDIQANLRVSFLFDGGICGEDAHDALRLSFHDAIGYSPLLKSQRKVGGDGADGSLIMFASAELGYPANEGLEEIVHSEKRFADKWGVSIQLAAAGSVRNCAGGPRISFLAGRPSATHASPVDLVTEAFDSVDKILARVQDAGLTPQELVDLLASHSIGLQDTVDPTISGTPFDTTPSVFDTKFYLETLLHGTVWPGDGAHPSEAMSPFEGELRLQSDAALAQYPRTSCYWSGFVNNQNPMASRFATSMAKLALLGQNPHILQDCSEVIPPPTLPNPPAATLPKGTTLELTVLQFVIILNFLCLLLPGQIAKLHF